MSYKDILVHAAEGEAGKRRAAFAAELAAAHDAHLTGVYVTEPLSLNPMIEANAGDEIRKLHKERGAEKRDAAKAAFDKAVKSAGARAEWAATEGMTDDMVGLRAIYADITIVGQDDESADNSPGIAHLPEHIALNVRRPMVVVPYAGKHNANPGHVMVAWNASPEAARAVSAAMPILQKAKKVSVLAINPVDLGDLPGADIAAHLSRHGVKAVADHVQNERAGASVQGTVFHGQLSRRVAHAAADHMPVGETLLSWAADNDAEMIVMGAYGQSRLRETLFGGASRHILRHMTVPVFMAH